jgi:tRNA U34 5-carboxymethylaminomethyl modifying enzyme MnmG/GidA
MEGIPRIVFAKSKKICGKRLTKIFRLCMIKNRRNKKAGKSAMHMRKKKNRDSRLERVNGYFAKTTAEGTVLLDETFASEGELYLEIGCGKGAFITELSRRVLETVEIDVKYEGYIKRAFAEAQRQLKLEDKHLSPDIDYTQIRGLRLEAAQKLNAIKPLTIGQASRISGVNPADVSVLLIWLGIK